MKWQLKPCPGYVEWTSFCLFAALFTDIRTMLEFLVHLTCRLSSRLSSFSEFRIFISHLLLAMLFSVVYVFHPVKAAYRFTEFDDSGTMLFAYTSIVTFWNLTDVSAVIRLNTRGPFGYSSCLYDIVPDGPLWSGHHLTWGTYDTNNS
jgi:hypothetical protein